MSFASGSTKVCYAGQSRLMHLQHNSPDSPDQERNGFAALRQEFPEPDIRNGLKSRNPNQSFAAGEFDVSVAGQNRHRANTES